MPIQVTIAAAAFCGVIWNWPILLNMWSGVVYIIAGTITAIFGTILLIWSLRSLDDAYSPCFESHIPHHLVECGPYRFMRHPIYTANLLTILGLFIASGSLWIALAFAIVCIYYVSSAYYEEAALVAAFPRYTKYLNTTGRFLPKPSIAASLFFNRGDS